MGDLIIGDFENKPTDSIKEFHKKHRRKFEPELDLLIFSSTSNHEYNRLSDELFSSIISQDKNKLDYIFKCMDPSGLMALIEGEQFLKSISLLLDDIGAMKGKNKGIKLFYENFMKRLSNKLKNNPQKTN